MKFSYNFKTKLEKFSEKIFFLLVENFSETYFVGGAVRDMLLHKKLTDIDLCTTAKPDQVIALLKNNNFKVDSKYKNFGVIIVSSGNLSIEISTSRKDSYTGSRYPKITWTKDIKTDSKRRDITINALYFSPKNNTITDFHDGLTDIKHKTIKFIGNPSKRLSEDPLRFIRAYRFKILLNFNLATKTQLALMQNKQLIKKLTKTRIEKEILKLPTKKMQNELCIIINKST
jgi:tRNA nucleotidyltransferase (CCA-adding enzyme)